jgi:TonB-dependent SusC/RagA subfamily outer membrane receptor
MKINAVFIQVRRLGKIILLGFITLLLLDAVSFAQQRTITGTVTCSDNNLPQPGVNILVQGSATGTITDMEGKYTIEVPADNAVLQFSFVGFNTELIEVGSSTVIDVVLKLTYMAIDEVVITSLGISREKKEITYAAQNVNVDEFSQARELNVANSLAGKVAGLDLIKSNAGVGSATRLLLRGNRTIAGQNQPVIVVDGVPIANETPGLVVNEGGGVQGADGIGNINPDDIESITVLKGPNAAAIYGSRANNGAIMITTKKGVARKGIGIEFTSNFTFEKPILLTRFQQKYGQGTAETYFRDLEWMWGPEMNGQMVDHWSPDPNWDGPAQYAYTPIRII